MTMIQATHGIKTGEDRQDISNIWFSFVNCCEMKGVTAPKSLGYNNLKLTHTSCRNSASNFGKRLNISYLLIQGFHSW